MILKAGDLKMVLATMNQILKANGRGAKWGYQQAVKDMEAETKADVIEEAIKETRDCMEEGSPKWFCRVEDLRKYADKLRGDHE